MGGLAFDENLFGEISKCITYIFIQSVVGTHFLMSSHWAVSYLYLHKKNCDKIFLRSIQEYFSEYLSSKSNFTLLSWRIVCECSCKSYSNKLRSLIIKINSEVCSILLVYLFIIHFICSWKGMYKNRQLKLHTIVR